MTQEYAYGMWVIAAFNVGLFLVITGFLVQWPTLLTVLMAPVLVYAYVRLARSEEHYMFDRFADAYREYRQRVPAFIPPMQQWKAFLLVGDSEEGGSHIQGHY